MTETLIIGAGLSGLIAARRLQDAGKTVALIDKGRGVGGRLATRRIGEATLDHGAQFFTVRGDDFRAVVDDALAAGVVDVWCHGFDNQDGYPRYYCPKGMTALAKWLAEPLDIELGVRATSIAADDTWVIELESGGRREADSLIVTSPVPQTVDLLDAGHLEVPEALRTLPYKSIVALLVTLDGPSAVPPPGGIQRTEDDLFTFIADNQQKGVSAIPALTFHVNGAYSSARYEDPPALVIADLLKEAAPWIGSAPIIDVELKKWRYAAPLEPFEARSLLVTESPGPLVLAGDAFGGPKVEGAFNSGAAAAGHLR